MVSKPGESGQSFLESMISLLLMVSVGVGALGLCLNFFGHIILTRWAAYNSRCVAVISHTDVCEIKTKSELQKYFGMKKIFVRTSILRGVISSQIKAPFIGKHDMTGQFDLQPSEFKRVQK